MQPKQLIHLRGNHLRVIVFIFFSIFFISGSVMSQIIPTNEAFSTYGSSNTYSSPITLVHQPGNPSMAYSFVQPATITGSTYLFVGDPAGSLFRPGNSALIFNYAPGDVIPGFGQPGNSLYRMHFTGA